MRITVTLEPDLARMLNDQAARSRKSFEETLNNAVRLGLSRADESNTAVDFVIEARPMGLRAGADPVRLNSLLDAMETECFAEKSAK